LDGAVDKRVVYPYAIRFAISTNDQQKIERLCKEFDKLSPMDQFAYAYHYNVLMSADSNTTVYGAGLYDLVPLAMMQHVHRVRRDIRLACYNTTSNPSDGDYICLSIGTETLATFPNAAYTGLLVRVGSDASTDELQRHFEEHFNMKLLQQGTYQGTETVRLYSNYLPGLVLLYKRYIKENNQKAMAVKTIMTQLAGRAGMTTEINKLME
jgi:hypothetical protein